MYSLLKAYKCLAVVTLLGSIGLSSCDSFQKSVSVDLPPYEGEVVVECYLEHNLPYRLLLTKSVDYFGAVKLPPLVFANVTIRHDIPGKNVPPFVLKFTPQPVKPGKFNFNYEAKVPPVDTNLRGTYELKIDDPESGQVITGKVEYLSPPHIDAVEARFRASDSTAFVLTKFQDNDPDKPNYYRIIVNRQRNGSKKVADFTFEGRFKTGNQIAIATGYDFRDKDTAAVKVYHLSKDYFDFIRTVDDAKQGNLNPFAQPTVVKSTLKGGLGVFAILAYSDHSLVVRRK